jgi:hypothetical protein
VPNYRTLHQVLPNPEPQLANTHTNDPNQFGIWLDGNGVQALD